MGCGVMWDSWGEKFWLGILGRGFYYSLNDYLNIIHTKIFKPMRRTVPNLSTHIFKWGKMRQSVFNNHLKVQAVRSR